MFVNVTFKAVWQFKEYPEYKVTRCKKIINSKKGNLLTYTNRGFFINGKYYKRKELNSMIEKIPKKELLPF